MARSIITMLMVAWIAPPRITRPPSRALAELRRRGLNVCLRFAGGAYRQARQAHLEDFAETLGVSGAVQFLGIRDDIPELMGASDVVVHATHSEGLPITILEAFAGPGLPSSPSDNSRVPGSCRRRTVRFLLVVRQGDHRRHGPDCDRVAGCAIPAWTMPWPGWLSPGSQELVPSAKHLAAGYNARLIGSS
jgi:hypothetical protein